MLTLLQENTDNLMISEKQYKNKMKSSKKRERKKKKEPNRNIGGREQND